jgi:hypothetical protein
MITSIYTMMDAIGYGKIGAGWNLKRKRRQEDLVDLMLGTQAPRAQVEALLLPVDSECNRMYIGNPAPVGPALGMADIMTKKRRFTAQIALQF